MGSQYALFRAGYELKRKLGILRSEYPLDPAPETFVTLRDWQRAAPPFFFDSREHLDISPFGKNGKPDPKLKQKVADLKAGKMTYFNGEQLEIGQHYDWLSNPLTSYRYDSSNHWTQIADLDPDAGDIKYVWEKSRFCYLYDLIRYDYHYGEDQSEYVWSEMESWMDANPINCGPNFRCSQEIALRCLNWTFALYYYRYSDIWTEERFQRVMHYIYWSFRHVYSNIRFSLISVRNNHAMSEAAGLWFAGLLFPFFPEASVWRTEGKKWLEGEIQYQIYEDGSYLQHSHNYHRVVMQMLTWAFYLGDLHRDLLSVKAEKRIRKSLEFLYLHQVRENGFLPNYGANDGALFFPLNDCEYRDYRPALNALYFFLEGKHLYAEGPWQEDAFWYSGSKRTDCDLDKQAVSKYGTFTFEEGGYYLNRKNDSLLSIRCASFRDRPAQADNLHMDLWYKGENIFRDAGVYRYNTTPFWKAWYNGTAAHNTVAMGNYDQMEKGPRFIWLHWSEMQFVEWKEEADRWIFYGRINAFKHMGKYNTHARKVSILKQKPTWIVEDTVSHGMHFPMRQYWHPGPAFEKFGFSLEAVDAGGKVLEKKQTDGWYSETYGLKESAPSWYFETDFKKIKTTIRATQ